MKKLFIIILLTLFFTGCSADFNKKEISDIDFIKILAIDYQDKNIIITGICNNYLEENSKLKTVKGKGKTVFEAMEDLKANNYKNISIAHTSFYLIGENAASFGVDNYMDYFIKDESVKVNALVLISKSTNASDFLKENLKEEISNYNNFNEVNQKELEVIKKYNNKILDITSNLLKNKEMFIPYVIAKEEGFVIEGLALLKDNKLYEYFSRERSLAYNLLNNNLKKMPIFLNDNIGLMVINPSTKVKTYTLDKNNYININIKCDTVLKEKNDDQSKLINKENKYIQKMCENVLDYLISEEIDLYRLKNVKKDNTKYKITSKINIKKSYIYEN